MSMIGKHLIRTTERSASGGGISHYGRVEVDFGATPLWSKTFTITDANITTASFAILAAIARTPGTGHSDDDDLDAFTVKCGTTASGSASATVLSLQGPVIGKYKLDYVILGAV